MKTMWSETLLEALYVAMEKKASDSKVREILKDLKSKGYTREYLVEKVEKKVGPKAGADLKRIYHSMGKGGGSGKSGAEKKGGLAGKLKGIFK